MTKQEMITLLLQEGYEEVTCEKEYVKAEPISGSTIKIKIEFTTDYVFVVSLIVDEKPRESTAEMTISQYEQAKKLNVNTIDYAVTKLLSAS